MTALFSILAVLLGLNLPIGHVPIHTNTATWGTAPRTTGAARAHSQINPDSVVWGKFCKKSGNC
jgi:hypothetical protein